MQSSSILNRVKNTLKKYDFKLKIKHFLSLIPKKFKKKKFSRFTPK